MNRQGSGLSMESQRRENPRWELAPLFPRKPRLPSRETPRGKGDRGGTGPFLGPGMQLHLSSLTVEPEAALSPRMSEPQLPWMISGRLDVWVASGCFSSH